MRASAEHGSLNQASVTSRQRCCCLVLSACLALRARAFMIEESPAAGAAAAVFLTWMHAYDMATVQYESTVGKERGRGELSV